ncbi:hypothetical protein [Hymenobacter radiodurans]|uniref:hypothetical protein n=1 Tax=Hymenobacter radiodurans TaxID=2496028 RepID=UPI001058570C|nr:hypothetical protein [Hymenobacter radiodurans]
MKKIIMILLVLISQACQSNAAPASAAGVFTYMQIFFTPNVLPDSAFITFTPTFQKQREIKLNGMPKNFADLGFSEMLMVQAKRNQEMRDTLIKTINTVTADGWEVVQMTSYGEGGLVYLLRHAK